MEQIPNENAARGNGRQGAGAPQDKDERQSTRAAQDAPKLIPRLEAVWRATGMNGSAKSVLVYLAFRGVKAFPKISLIAEQTCLSRATVLRAIRWLERNDWIRVEKTGKANRYYLNLARLNLIDTSSKDQDGSRGMQADAAEVAPCNMDPDPKGTRIEHPNPEPAPRRRWAPVQERRTGSAASIAAVIREIQRYDPHVTLETMAAQRDAVITAFREVGVRGESWERLWTKLGHSWSETGIRPLEQVNKARSGIYKGSRDPAAVLVHRLLNPYPPTHASK